MTKLFFDHFPKTAGTSLYMFLLEALGEESVSPHLQGVRLDSALALYGQKKVVIGHFLLRPDICLPTGYISATVLRNPRERTLSEYFYIMSYPVSANIDTVARLIKQSTLEDVFNDKSMCQGFINPQAIHYAGLLHPTPGKLLDDELLQVAKESLNRFQIVGTTELLPELIDKMRSLFPFDERASLKTHNVTSNRKEFRELPSTIQARIDELIRVDQSLWEYAGVLFRSRTQALTADTLPESLTQETSKPIDLTSGLNKPESNNTTEPYESGLIDNVTVTVIGQSGTPDFILAGELVTLGIRFRVIEDIDDLTVGYSIKHESGLHLFGVNSRIYGYQIQCKAGGEYYVNFIFPAMLGLGKYTINLSMHSGDTHLEHCYFLQDGCATFEVTSFLGPYFEGVIRLMPSIMFGANSSDGMIGAVDILTREDVFSSLGADTPEIFDARGSLTTLTNIASVGKGERFTIRVEINNRSKQNWHGEGNQPVHLSYHWLDERGEIVVYDGYRSYLSSNVIRPNQTIRADALVEAPDRHGSHILVISLVQEGVNWFENLGFQPARTLVDIVPKYT